MSVIDEMNQKIKSCLQDEDPFCTSACPFHLNVKDFVQKLKRGSVDAAYKAYRNATGFPQIAALLCEHPCQDVCPRKETDSAIQLNLLEQAVCQLTKNKKPTDYNIPKKNFRIAVVGGGITGLGCTLRLAEKKYQVTLFEKSDKLGGTLKQILPEEILQSEISNQFMFIEYDLRMNHEIKSLDELAEFDAVYIATGNGGNDFGLLKNSLPGHFIGGSILGLNKMEALAMGLLTTNSVEWWLKTKNMPPKQEYTHCQMQIDTESIHLSPAILPANGTYTKEEMICEAKRCLECSCDGCRRYCDLFDIYKKLPKRLKDEVENSINPKNVDGGGYTYKRLMAACNACGQCKEHCPREIDFGSYILEGRAKIQEKGQMPPAFYGYWLADCEHAMSPVNIVTKLPEQTEKADFAFFPGCQLGASDPEYVKKTYAFLCAIRPGMGIALNCCGVPALWAGKTKMHQESLGKLKKQWEDLGKPVYLFSCPTCYEQFKQFLPEIPRQMIYELPEIEQLAKEKAEKTVSQTLSVFDPCASRHNPSVQKAVRKLVITLGHTEDSLNCGGENAMCCSWGGHGSIANPDFAKKVIKRRIEQNEHPYVAYCINCRDIFAAAGKPTYHILDLLFDLYDSQRQPPLLSDRRRNREKLAAAFNGKPIQFREENIVMQNENKYHVEIPESLKEEMSRNYILEETALQVINHCENHNETIFSKNTQHYFGHLRIDYATYWVEYEKHSDRIKLVNVYSHRMNIDDE